MTRVGAEILGQPSVSVDGITLPLSGRQLAVAIRLVLARQRPVSSARLLSAWPGGSGSDGALRVTLTRLRPMLAPAQISRLEGGYLITPTAVIDADVFEEHVRVARDTSQPFATRLARVEAALALWHGPALDGLGDLDWARHEAARLDELHEQARDLRYELILGAPAGEGPAPHDVLAELTADATATPAREHRAGLLATALYRVGRQAEALDVLSATRRHLHEHLGLAPGRALDELELQILNHDPRLAEPSAATVPHPEIERQLVAARTLLSQDAGLAAEAIADAAVGAARSHGHRGQLASALLVLAHTAMATGSRPTDPLIDEAQAHARVAGSSELLAEAALARFGRGVPSDWQRALVELTEPLVGLPPAHPYRVKLLAAAAAVLAFNASPGATEQLLNAAEDTHRAVGTPRSEAVWLATRAIVSPDRTMADARRAVEVAEQTGDPRLILVALHALLRVGFAHGELSVVEAALDRLDECSRRAGVLFGRVRVPIARGALALARGDLDGAAAAIDQIRQVGQAVGSHAAGPAADVQGMLLALERNEAGQLLPVVRAAAAASPALSWWAVAALLGDAGDVERLITRLADADAGDDRYGVGVALAAWAALDHGHTELADWTRTRLARMPGVVTIGFGTLVLGPAALFLGHAELALGRLEAALTAYRNAEALAARAGARKWEVEARLWQARVFAEQGDPVSTDALLDATPAEPGWARLAVLRDDIAGRLARV